MVDGFKVIQRRNLERLRNHPLLNWKIADVTHTGEVTENRYPTAIYKGLIFTDRKTHIEIAGSLHKFVNDGIHNYNDFYLKQIQRVIYQLCSEIGITACLTQIVNLEFGVNVKLINDPNLILRSLIMYRGGIFSFQKSTNKEYRECKQTQYYVKIYNKGLQYGLTYFLIRIEIKYIKMEQLNKLGIKYLSDVMNPSKLGKLEKLLLSVYDDIIIGDVTINPNRLNKSDQLLFANGHNPEWWKTIKPDSKSFVGGTSNREFRAKDKKYYRELNRFNLLLKQTGATKSKDELRKLIKVKINQCLKLTDPDLNRMSEIDRPLVKETFQSEHCKVSEIDLLLYSDNIRPIIKKCIVTGFDISMQKEDSKFLCTSGLKYYKENNARIWEKLLRRLSKKWHLCSEDILIREIHHSIRNEYFNKKHNARRSINNVLKDPPLFNQIPFIRRDKLYLSGFFYNESL